MVRHRTPDEIARDSIRVPRGGSMLITEREFRHLVQLIVPVSEVVNFDFSRPIKYGPINLYVITHMVTMVEKPTKAGHDWDMELVQGVWDVRMFYLCPRCHRRYRCGHHDISKCRKMYSDTVADGMGVFR